MKISRTEAETSIAKNLAFTATLTAQFPTGNSPTDIMRRKCLDCCCGDRVEVENCPIVACALWPFRFGGNPISNRKGSFGKLPA